MDNESDRTRTINEIVVETALSVLPEMSEANMVGVIIAGQVLPNGKTVTVWQFVNCPDTAVQAASLRQVADMIEGKLGELETPS